MPNIRVVLLETSHPGNIGATARAMKTMGLTQLYLVNPKQFPAQQATILAAGADDILSNAHVVQSLDEALGPCELIFGTSARQRSLAWSRCTPKQAAAKMIREPDDRNIALVFGREDKGLLNEELQQCHHHVHIPSNSDYGSLNLAAAVQILCYEIRAHTDEQQSIQAPVDQTQQGHDTPIATQNELNGFYQHLQQTLIDIDFLNPQTPNQVMPRLKRLFFRARPNQAELNILRGILKAMQQSKS